MPRFKPDTMDDVKNSDLIQLSRGLLDSVVESTNLLDPKQMTPAKVTEAKIVLGFLNSSLKALQTKMRYFQLIGISDKIKAVQKSTRSTHYS